MKIVMKKYYIYIVTNKPRGVLYIGVTNNLMKRIQQHNSSHMKSFTGKYNLHYLVYYEEFDEIYDAIQREKQLKNRYREWKINLIEIVNPDWESIVL